MIHIVLFEPEIPQNTGNIIRTCSATNAKLHLIEPLGFILKTSEVKRSAMDYGNNVDLIRHDDLDSFYETLKPEDKVFYLSRYGYKTHSNFEFNEVEGDIYLMFGKESTGIPKDVLKKNHDTTFRIPMSASARSLNLSNTVAITVYEVLRQLGYPDLETHEVIKGEDFILK